jgi:GNAT superfamily N-acetyltransferase
MRHVIDDCDRLAVDHVDPAHKEVHRHRLLGRWWSEVEGRASLMLTSNTVQRTRCSAYVIDERAEVAPMEIRMANSGDYELVLPLFLGLREFSRAGHPPQHNDFETVLSASRDYLRDILARGPSCRTLLAIDDDGSLAGYLVVTVHEPNPLASSGVVRTGTIDELFVDANHRGTGAGKLLLDAAFDWLIKQGAERAEVGAYAWNTAGIAFYEREGFKPWTITLMKHL